MISLGAMMARPDVEALLDAHDTYAGQDVERFIPREKAAAIISAALWGFGCRDTSTSGAYASMALFDALGLKFWSFDEGEAKELQEWRVAHRKAKYEAMEVSAATSSEPPQ